MADYQKRLQAVIRCGILDSMNTEQNCKNYQRTCFDPCNFVTGMIGMALGIIEHSANVVGSTKIFLWKMITLNYDSGF